MKRVLLVNAVWDDEAQVWVATSDDVPGLATEAETWEALMAKLRILVPELLEANGIADLDDVPLEVLGRRFENLGRMAA